VPGAVRRLRSSARAAAARLGLAHAQLGESKRRCAGLEEALMEERAKRRADHRAADADFRRAPFHLACAPCRLALRCAALRGAVCSCVCVRVCPVLV
jgi:hypothetical protein